MSDMKKALSLLLVLLLALSLLAGCGGGQSAGGGQSSGAPVEAKTSEEPPKEEPAGPVELNKIVFEESGLRITALSYEDKLSKAESMNDTDPVFDLRLNIEFIDPALSSASVVSASVNGFRYLNHMSFLGGSSPERMNWLLTDGYGPSFSEGREYTVSLTKGFADYLELRSIGEIGLLFDITGEDSPSFYKNVTIDLGREAQPRCGVSLKNCGSSMEIVSAELTNPESSPVLAECVVNAWDKEGQPLFNQSFNFRTGQELMQGGAVGRCYIKSGAKDEPCALSAATSMMLYENGEDVGWRDIARVEAELISAVPVDEDDLSGSVSCVQEGRWERSKNFMLYRCQWPDEYLKIKVYGTCLVYGEDNELIRVIPIETVLAKDKDYRDVNQAANKETGYDDAIAVDCKKEGSGPDFRFELYLNYVTEVEE